MNAVHCPFTLVKAPLRSKFEKLVPKLSSVTKFSYTHLKLPAASENSFSVGFSSFLREAAKALHLPWGGSCLMWGSPVALEPHMALGEGVSAGPGPAGWPESLPREI